MTAAAKFDWDDFATRVVRPRLELGAYEALWLMPRASFKTIADTFRANPGALPSELIDPQSAEACASEAVDLLREKLGDRAFGVRVHGAGEYPNKLRDADHPVELLYYRGWWDLVETRCVAVVGSRKVSDEGKRRTARIAKLLVERDITVVSGLAQGVDTVAHTTALARGGRTIAVLGTPITEVYPKSNSELQTKLASEHLVISQVPILRYGKQNPKSNRFFFPARNVTMSALTEATIIVEASDTSGTLVQARAALAQGRKLLILDSCFQRKDLTWPARFQRRGAIRIRDEEELFEHLAP